MKTARTLSWLVALAGVWLVLSPFILGYSGTTVAMWNAIIIGLALIVVEVWAANTESVTVDKYLDWVSAVLGLWLILSPFILGFSALVMAMWNFIIIGVVVIVLSLWAEFTLGKPVALQQ